MKNPFKKLVALSTAVMLVLGLTTATPVKADDVTVYVTIVNGEPVVVQQEISVTDIDNDGALTINDVLILTHDAAFEGGSAAGYASVSSDWGLSITKLWGIENGGSYGYYLNNAMSMGLTDPVKNGDYLTAWIYQDTTAYSDTYAFFDLNTRDAFANEEVTLTLYANGYDESWNVVSAPLAQANILVDGTPINTQTAADGTVNLGILAPGKHVITAAKDDMILVTPVCTVNVSEENITLVIAPAPLDTTPNTDATMNMTPALVAAVLLLIICPALIILKKKNEAN